MSGATAPDPVRRLYEATPFPSLGDVETREAGLRSMLANCFGVDPASLQGATLLDAGCGTGEYSAAWRRIVGERGRVVGLDLSMSSLVRARRLGEGHGQWVEGSVLAPPVRGPFDVVWSSGVLHHTGRPHEGARALSALVRPGGHLIVGLYHPWGRWRLRWARASLRMLHRSGTKAYREGARAWLRAFRPDWTSQAMEAHVIDQFEHVRESHHTVRELRGWMDAASWEWLGVSPLVTRRGKPGWLRALRADATLGRVEGYMFRVAWRRRG
ncbi:MAG: methyltransferase domain-containing protein [Planctomycetes bacterium]|nr:methyltransferase domain-containing protein [Planctomycetota bacterium]